MRNLEINIKNFKKTKDFITAESLVRMRTSESSQILGTILIGAYKIREIMLPTKPTKAIE